MAAYNGGCELGDSGKLHEAGSEAIRPLIVLLNEMNRALMTDGKKSRSAGAAAAVKDRQDGVMATAIRLTASAAVWDRLLRLACVVARCRVGRGGIGAGRASAEA